MFNRSVNYDYIGKLAAVEHYGPEQMKPEARATFLAWHEQHKDDTFNFLAAIMTYCKQVSLQ
jgi:hypothetical protein